MMSAVRKDQVDTPSILFDEMMVQWGPIIDLMGGTPKMRDAGDKWLPKENKEGPQSYKSRLNGSFLYPMFGDTVSKIAGRPFSQPVTITPEKLSDWLQSIVDDVDHSNKSLTQLCGELLEDAIAYGKTHLLVDYPSVPALSNLEEERKLGARATFVHVKARQLISWETKMSNMGVTELVSVRIAECRVEKQGKFLDQEVKYIRVYTSTTWELWKEQDGKNPGEKDWVKHSGGTHSFGQVPLVTFYTNRTGFMTAEPPLMALAWLNIEHWQSSSGQRHILKFARAGTFFGAGFKDGELPNEVEVGPNRIITSANADAKLTVVEHTGASIEAGERDLRRIQDEGEVLGVQPLVDKAANQTASGKDIDDSNSKTTLQTWVQKLEDDVMQAFKFAATWHGQVLPADFKVDIFDDFAGISKGGENIDRLIAARGQGDISRETLLDQMRLNGTLPEDFDVKAEISRIEQEGPPLGTAGLQDPNNPNQPNPDPGVTSG